MLIEIDRNERWLYGIADEGFDSNLDDGTYAATALNYSVNFVEDTKNCVLIKSSNCLTIKLEDMCFLGHGKYGHYELVDVYKVMKVTLHETYANDVVFFEGSWTIDNELKGFWKITINNKV